jgi:outer membrane protein assembly factor BamB
MKKKKAILIILLGILIVIITSCIPEKSYDINITTIGNGTYSIDPDKDSYKAGESVIITAIPNEFYKFSHWSGDVDSTDNPLKIKITKEMNILANFDSKFWKFETRSYIYSSPAIGSDGTIYVGSDDGKLYAINPDGSEKWFFEANGAISSSPAIGNDGTIYVGSYRGNLYAINPDGSEKWSFYNYYSSISSSPAIGSDGTIYVGSDDGKLYAINPNGSEKWFFEANGAIYSSPAIGSDGTIYVGSNDGKLYAIEGDSEGLADSPWPKFGKNNRNTGNYNDSE